MKNNYIITIISAVILATASVFGFPMVAKAQLTQAQSAVSQDKWSAAQLDNLVAPIALYPDPLLSQMLVASTYPLEVVEAHQWLQKNPGLSGQALMDAARQQPWDSSVQALVATPDALDTLYQDVQWTTDLGNAFLAQEVDVTSAVQRMRARAEADGRLQSTEQQTVTTEENGGRQVIVIEPANPDIIYVPVYDPFYVWGPPIIGFYPPLYYPTFGFGFGVGSNLSFCFGSWGGWGVWGWTPNWYGRTVYLNNRFFYNHQFHENLRGDIHGRTVWVHHPEHRLGVPYSNGRIARQFHGREALQRVNRQSSRNSGVERGNRAALPPAHRNENPAHHSYAPQSRFGNRQNQAVPQAQRFENRAQLRNQAPLFRNHERPRNTAPRAHQYVPRTPERQFGGSFNRGNAGGFSRGAARSFGHAFGRNAGHGFSHGGGRRR
jgi:hypothetical protein